MADLSPDKRREDVLDVRNQMAARAIQWERQPGIHNGVTIAEELRWWIDRFDEAMPASTPSHVAQKPERDRSKCLDGTPCAATTTGCPEGSCIRKTWQTGDVRVVNSFPEAFRPETMRPSVPSTTPRSGATPRTDAALDAASLSAHETLVKLTKVSRDLERELTEAQRNGRIMVREYDALKAESALSATPRKTCAQDGHVWVGTGDERVVCDDCGIEKGAVCCRGLAPRCPIPECEGKAETRRRGDRRIGVEDRRSGGFRRRVEQPSPHSRRVTLADRRDNSADRRAYRRADGGKEEK